MLSPPTPEQTAYEDRTVRVIRTAQAVMQRHGRWTGPVDWDHGVMAMLPDSAEHTLRFPKNPEDVVVTIRAEWFLDPSHYRTAIEGAVEAALAT